MNIGVIGATGYVGKRLSRLAAAAGHVVVPFSRSAHAGFRRIESSKALDFSGLDAVVNLAGEPILGPWTASKKKKILSSRVETTQRVVESLHSGVGVLINASAIGFYGNTGEREVDESAPAGSGFLAEVCQAWEAAAMPAEALGCRLVRLRIGFVTGPGGAMGLVRPVFQLGLGGNLGNGRQWMSCIHVDDVAGMILWALENQSVSGAVNAVNPEPVRNAEFTRTLAKVLQRPAILPAPSCALKLALGELSHVLLDSVRVRPGVAQRLAYAFSYPTLEAGLRAG
ncbi:MAG: TIGR01777 family oxidoreductase [bacterium]